MTGCNLGPENFTAIVSGLSFGVPPTGALIYFAGQVRTMLAHLNERMQVVETVQRKHGDSIAYLKGRESL